MVLANSVGGGGGAGPKKKSPDLRSLEVDISAI